jgi:hypothetical protein
MMFFAFFAHKKAPFCNPGTMGRTIPTGNALTTISRDAKFRKQTLLQSKIAAMGQLVHHTRLPKMG